MMPCPHFSDTGVYVDRLIDVSFDFIELIMQYAEQKQKSTKILQLMHAYDVIDDLS